VGLRRTQEKPVRRSSATAIQRGKADLWYVTLLSIAACFALAWSLASRKAPTNDDGSVKNTGHVWDEDLVELNNPLPRWWLYLFYLTCVFGLIYLLMYPGLGNVNGFMHWSSADRYRAEIERANEQHAPLFAEYLAQDIPHIATQPAAIAMGERLFLTYCSQCHGSTAAGARGFPNLTDDDWLGEGTPDYIAAVITLGRNGVMPAMGPVIGGAEEVENLAHYVLSLSDSDHDSDRAAKGSTSFTSCAACHNSDGTGNPLIGAPNLTDDTWLYGGSINSITHAINNGLNNAMPAFGKRLDEGKIRVLAAYVWSLSHTDDATDDAQ